MGRRSGKCDIVTGAWDHHKLLNSKPLPLSLVPAIAAGVSNTDTMPLCEFHKVKRVSFTHSRHFLFAHSSLGLKPSAMSPCCTVHLSRIFRVIKRMDESQKNLQNLPWGRKKDDCLSCWKTGCQIFFSFILRNQKIIQINSHSNKAPFFP